MGSRASKAAVVGVGLLSSPMTVETPMTSKMPRPAEALSSGPYYGMLGLVPSFQLKALPEPVDTWQLAPPISEWPVSKTSSKVPDLLREELKYRPVGSAPVSYYVVPGYPFILAKNGNLFHIYTSSAHTCLSLAAGTETAFVMDIEAGDCITAHQPLTRYPGLGNDLVRLAISIARSYPDTRYIELKDVARLRGMTLQHLSLLRTGRGWYESFGFKAIDDRDRDIDVRNEVRVRNTTMGLFDPETIVAIRTSDDERATSLRRRVWKLIHELGDVPLTVFMERFKSDPDPGLAITPLMKYAGLETRVGSSVLRLDLRSYS